MYIKSDVVLKAVLGDEGGDKLLDFIRGFIIPHEQSFCFTCKRVYGTSKPQPETWDMKEPIMLSNPVRLVSFLSMQLTNLPRFKPTRTVPSLTSTIDIGLAHLLQKQPGVPRRR